VYGLGARIVPSSCSAVSVRGVEVLRLLDAIGI
jgi:hypothetical protein